MRARWLIVVAALAGCSPSKPPKAWPVIVTVHFTSEGINTKDACVNQTHLEAFSFEDLSHTAVRVANGETSTCVVPVDRDHEQFVIEEISCRRIDRGANHVDVDFSLHTGESGGTITLGFPGVAGDAGGEPWAQVSRSFGAGVVIHDDLTAFTVGGEGSCDVVGYYVDRGAAVLGPVRIERDIRRRPKRKN